MISMIFDDKGDKAKAERGRARTVAEDTRQLIHASAGQSATRATKRFSLWTLKYAS